MLSEPIIQELREIIKRDYGRDISFEEASEIAHGLVRGFDLMSKIYARMSSNSGKEEV